jgi:hypothetical protein
MQARLFELKNILPKDTVSAALCNLYGRLPCEDICRLVDVYHYGASFVDLSCLFHVPTAVHLIKALAKSAFSPLECVSLIVHYGSADCIDVWNALAQLPMLHTLALRPTSVPHYKDISETNLLFATIGDQVQRPLEHVTTLVLYERSMGPHDHVELKILRRMLPNLQVVHWTDAGAVEEAGVIGAFAQFLVEVGFIPQQYHAELLSCSRLEKLTLMCSCKSHLELFAADWNIQWPHLSYLELIHFDLDVRTYTMVLLIKLARLPASFKTLFLRTPRNASVLQMMNGMISKVKQATGTLPIQRLCLCLEYGTPKSLVNSIVAHGVGHGIEVFMDGSRCL